MRRLLASIHDVGPRFETEVDRLLELVQRHVGPRIALLVVPDHWNDAPIRAGSAFAGRLRRWSDDGLEIFLHGFYHRDDQRHRGPMDRFRARAMTAGEGEFLGLSRQEAGARIARGRALLEDVIGRPIAGFVAPAWLYGRGALDALQDCAIPVAEDHLRIWSPVTGEILSRSPVITWASRSASRRQWSLIAAAGLRRLPLRDLRIGVHPGDCASAALLASIAKTLRIAARTRRPSTYSELRIAG